MSDPAPPQLVLASTSSYRATALEQLQIPFTVVDPETDESPQSQEAPQALAERLARAKALAVAARVEDSVIIGSDQVGHCAGRLLGKPGDQTKAVEQLYAARGKRAQIYTALAVHDQRQQRTFSEVVVTDLKYRNFSRSEVAHYVAIDNPIDCAGSFKVESLGIALFSSINSADPSALVGLPLIALVTFLTRCGLSPLTPHDQI